jgi:maltose alpha-D-glucosyltransferase/alpha-amylase
LSYVGTPATLRQSLLELSDMEAPEDALETIGSYLGSARLLGQRTAELHLALASNPSNPAFAPESFTDLYRRSLYQSLRNLTGQVFDLLNQRRPGMPEPVRRLAQEVVERRDEVLDRFRHIMEHRIVASRIRCHGDYHLGQVLYTGNDFVIIDFEGEPARAITERRLKRNPLRDVAGMVRSFHYATNAALTGQAPILIRTEDVPALEQWGSYWYAWVSAAFLNSYLNILGESPLLPRDRGDLDTLLNIYLLEKAVYEIGYELNNRPDWVRVPLAGVLNLLGPRA